MARMLKSLVVSFALLICAAGPLAAQEPTLKTGDLVRVFTFDLDKCWPCQGNVRSLKDSTLTIQRENSLDFVRLSLDELERVELAVIKSGAGRSWQTPALLGSLLGATIGLATCSNIESGDCARSTFIGLGAGALLGAGLGFAIGATKTYEDWQIVPLENLRVSWLPGGYGFGVSASIAFD